MVDEVLAKGVSMSAWSSPMLVPKKDWTFWFCVDYRSPNGVSMKDVYMLPQIDDILNIQSASLHLISVVSNGKLNCILILVWSQLHGLHKFVRLPFGTVQWSLNISEINGGVWNSCFIYSDNALVWSCTSKGYLKHLGQILEGLCNENFKLKPIKCLFIQDEVGHAVTREGFTQIQVRLRE